MSGLAGAVVWAVVPYVPEAPFRLYAGEDHSPIVISDSAKLIASGQKGGDAELTFLVPGKARPVLILSDREDERLEELIALRLLQLDKLTEKEQEAVRAGEDLGLFLLDPERFDLPGENAAIIAALVRVHRSAIDQRTVGQLSETDLREVHGRVATYYGLDLRELVRDELKRLGDAQRRRRS